MKYKILGKTELKPSICGFGGYRIDYRYPVHAEALRYALENGINLIDTSSNYSDGGSEILVGHVLKDLFGGFTLKREDIIIVTKGGYLQGNNLQIAIEKERNQIPFKEIVQCNPELWHCIHPDFLEDQISRSLKRMNLDYVNVYMLHNPEYFLNYTYLSSEHDLIEEYYSRIYNAFVHLEKEVASGRIRHYGVSSNTFGDSPTKRDFTSLEKVISVANNISSNNHFGVIQFPMNLLERDAVFNKNQANKTKSVIDIARENNLGVLINRPLNAIIKNKLIRLTDFPKTEARAKEEVLTLLEDVCNIEDSLVNKYSNKLHSNIRRSVVDCLTVGITLKSYFNRFDGITQYRELKKQYLIPRVQYAVDEFQKIQPHDEKMIRELNQYITEANIILDSIESIFADIANNSNLSYHKKTDRYLSEKQQQLPLSQKAILMLNSLDAVGCTLVGMRTKDYIDDVLKSIDQDYAADAINFWESE
ncbi:MAG: aldo/keto reductase [bacterium]